MPICCNYAFEPTSVKSVIHSHTHRLRDTHTQQMVALILHTAHTTNPSAHFKCIFKDTPWCVFRQIVCKYEQTCQAHIPHHIAHTHTLSKDRERKREGERGRAVESQATGVNFSTPSWRIKIGLPPPHTHTQRLIHTHSD